MKVTFSLKNILDRTGCLLFFLLWLRCPAHLNSFHFLKRDLEAFTAEFRSVFSRLSLLQHSNFSCIILLLLSFIPNLRNLNFNNSIFNIKFRKSFSSYLSGPSFTVEVQRSIFGCTGNCLKYPVWSDLYYTWKSQWFPPSVTKFHFLIVALNNFQ